MKVAASPLRMTKRGDVRRSLDSRFPSYRPPSPRGEGAPKGRIGHWRYERQMKKQRGARHMWGKREPLTNDKDFSLEMTIWGRRPCEGSVFLHDCCVAP